MSLFFLPFSKNNPEPARLCSLCDLPAAFSAIIRIRISDPATTKLVMTDLDFYVCQQHSYSMDIQMDKILKVEKKALLIFMP